MKRIGALVQPMRSTQAERDATLVPAGSPRTALVACWLIAIMAHRCFPRCRERRPAQHRSRHCPALRRERPHPLDSAVQAPDLGHGLLAAAGKRGQSLTAVAAGADHDVTVAAVADEQPLALDLPTSSSRDHRQASARGGVRQIMTHNSTHIDLRLR